MLFSTAPVVFLNFCALVTSIVTHLNYHGVVTLHVYSALMSRFACCPSIKHSSGGDEKSITKCEVVHRTNILLAAIVPVENLMVPLLYFSSSIMRKPVRIYE